MKLIYKLIFLIVIFIGMTINLSQINQYLGDDDAATQIATSGYTLEEIQKEFSRNQNILEFGYLSQFRTVSNARGPAHTIKSLEQDDPHLTPAYFILNLFWMSLAGGSIFSARTLPFLIGIVSLFALYYLCLEIFNSKLTGWLAATFFSVSPVFWQFLTFIRFYSLLLLLTLASTLVLLRALRTNKLAYWVAYSALISFGFYNYLFSALVAGGHLCYVLFNCDVIWVGTRKRFFLSFSAASASFFPWILVILNQQSVSEDKTSWLDVNLSLASRVLSWMHNFSVPFLDLSGADFTQATLGKILLVKIPDLLAFAFVFFAFYVLISSTKKQVWSLVTALTLSTVLPLILLDFYRGTIISIVLRYLLPSYIGILLATVHLLTVKINQPDFKQRFLWIGVLALSLLGCITTTSFYSMQAFQQNDFFNQRAAAFNANPGSIVSSENIYRLIKLSYEVDPS